MKKQGVTLVEVMVAALILALAVGGVLFVFGTEKVVTARTGRRVMAMDYAIQRLDILKNAVTATDWVNDSGALAETNPNWTPSPPEQIPSEFGDPARFNCRRSYRVTNVGPANNPNYKQVEVKLEWDEPEEQP
jgi:type II secretory pathway pseudopilin PulG